MESNPVQREISGTSGGGSKVDELAKRLCMYVRTVKQMFSCPAHVRQGHSRELAPAQGTCNLIATLRSVSVNAVCQGRSFYSIRLPWSLVNACRSVCVEKCSW